jgi:hypothetical protein
LLFFFSHVCGEGGSLVSDFDCATVFTFGGEDYQDWVLYGVVKVLFEGQFQGSRAGGDV